MNGTLSRWLLGAVLALSLPGCQSPPVPPVTPGQPVTAIPPLNGRVESWSQRSVAATLNEVAAGSTVSFIDPTTGNTVSTTVTDANGNFSLVLSNAWRPQNGSTYYLEAVKGLSVGGDPNRAGGSVARVRTIVAWNNGGWQSLTGLFGSLVIGKSTTTIASLAALKSLVQSDQNALIGSISGPTFSGTSAVSVAEYNQVYGLVDTALTNNQDPIEVLTYNPAGATLTDKYKARPGNLVLFDTYSTSVGGAIATPSGTVTFNGQNFPGSASEATVSLGPVPVATWSVNALHTQLTATLPANAYGGVLQVARGASTWTGPFVPVSGTVGTVAGGLNGFVGGRGQGARFGLAQGIAIDQVGNLYIADNDNNAIRQVTPAGLVSTYAGTGAYGLVNGAAATAQFGTPIGAAYDRSTGNLYVADDSNNVIRLVTSAGNVSTFAGTGASGAADGPVGSATFNAPYAVAVDGSGSVYVCDRGNSRIRKIAAGAVSTLAGSTSGFLDGLGTAAQFNTPEDLVVDTAGNVYVADASNNRIRKITPGGLVSTFAGTGAYGSANGATSSATFGYPIGIAIDASGSLYVGDNGTNLIRKIAAGTVSTIAGSGGTGLVDGPALLAQFAAICGMAVDASGNVYIMDRRSQRVRVWTP